ncbi:unnamed protein product [Amoebophrya sp. A25]|nr:unnamed protein product [Amoebophrya sp. A25]|eukprot:GSA25T00002636001.1
MTDSDEERSSSPTRFHGYAQMTEEGQRSVCYGSRDRKHYSGHAREPMSILAESNYIRGQKIVGRYAACCSIPRPLVGPLLEPQIRILSDSLRLTSGRNMMTFAERAYSGGQKEQGYAFDKTGLLGMHQRVPLLPFREDFHCESRVAHSLLGLHQRVPLSLCAAKDEDAFAESRGRSRAKSTTCRKQKSCSHVSRGVVAEKARRVRSCSRRCSVIAVGLASRLAIALHQDPKKHGTKIPAWTQADLSDVEEADTDVEVTGDASYVVVDSSGPASASYLSPGEPGASPDSVTRNQGSDTAGTASGEPAAFTVSSFAEMREPQVPFCEPPAMVVAQGEPPHQRYRNREDRIYELGEQEASLEQAMRIATEPAFFDTWSQFTWKAPLRTCLNTPKMYEFLNCEQVHGSQSPSCSDAMVHGVPQLRVGSGSASRERFVMKPKMKARDSNQFWRKPGTLCNIGTPGHMDMAGGDAITVTALTAVNPADLWENSDVKAMKVHFSQGNCVWMEDFRNGCKKTVCSPLPPKQGSHSRSP